MEIIGANRVHSRGLRRVGRHVRQYSVVVFVVDPSLVRRYLTFMRTTVSTKGQIILPAEIRREDDIKSGQEFEIERLDRGEYLLKRTTKPRNRGLVKLLLSCPMKDWFQPLDRTETTEDIKLPKLG